jgi:hypothetical protein
VHLIVIPTGTYTATVIEARKALLNDAKLCREGVLVYKIDANTYNGDGPIRVQPAHASDPTRVAECGNSWDAVFGSGEIYEDETVKVRVAGSGATGFGIDAVRKN